MLLSATAGDAAAQETGSSHVVVISGLSGEPRFGKAFGEWGASIVTAASEKYGVPAANVIWLAESKDVHPRVRDASRAETVQRELRALALRAGPQDRILIVLIGHGSAQGTDNRINLPGPDLTGAQFDALLDGFGSRRVALVNTASASGGFIADLAAPNRIVITATKSGFEQNEALFGGHFAAAFSGDGADTDQDGRLSLLEAFEYARLETARAYERTNRLRTEHATLDALGDGTGVQEANAQSEHGRIARTFFIGGGAGPANASPALRALLAEKDRIEAELDALRARKDSMEPAAYEKALEDLLVKLAENGQAIRQAGGS